MRTFYPFSAIVGQEEMKTALLLTSVDPGIGGVLIQGHKGTAKSTAVRALASLLPPINKVKGCPYNCPPDIPGEMHNECLSRYEQTGPLSSDLSPVSFVELPLSATEDRVTGTLHIEHALKTGERRFDPGILASANRGILYIDEVNLLEDHLVDMILDSAASGYNIVEREGISLVHPSRFILIGTMNPEEGELRPQFIDRFGLSVIVKGIDDRKARIEIAKRRIAFDASPGSFINAFSEEDKFLSEQVRNAKQRLHGITVPDAMWNIAVTICIRAKVRGHRADIILIKSAAALAALMEKDTVTIEEIKAVLPLVLPHRMESAQLETPEKIREKVSELINTMTAGFDEHCPDKSQGEEDIDSIDIEKMQVPGAGAVGSILFTFLKKNRKKSTNPNT